ncbi:hypothetical protein HY839_03475 [Candidatus Azambacteria bacterium]|nr:hypothetical protein [Candidatus Azambacteria bacterium]
MIIELYGLPGTGKTTVAKKIEERTDFKIVAIKNKGELVWLNIIFFLKHPLRSFLMLRYILANSRGWRTFYYKFMNCFLLNNAKYQKAAYFKNALIDQGYFQNIISVFEAPLNAKALKRYTKLFLPSDMLLIFSAPSFVREQRTDQRGRFSREQFGDEYVTAWKGMIEKNDALLKEYVSELPARSRIVDAGRDSDEVFREVIEIITAHAQ